MRISFLYAALLIGSLKLLALTPVSGQELENIKVTLELSDETFKSAFEKIEKQTDLLFSYNQQVSKYKAVTLPKGLYSVKEVLDRMFEETSLKYWLEGKYIIISVEEKQEEESSKGLLSESAVEQPALITGKVVDETTQQPIPGVNIIVKQTTRGTASDAQGIFAIDALENETLIFSFIGFKTKEIVLTNQTELNVFLQTEATTLQEVTVNAGYYDVKEKEKTGSISKIGANVIANQPVANPLQAMQGRMPGVYISQVTGMPGSNFQVQIRGTNSIQNGNNPLYVIDGVPFVSETLSGLNTSTSTYGPLGVSPLASINPNDIESIEVLKDADATAIYGSRGANGVVLITTKKGKAGGVKFDLNLTSGVSQVTRRLDMMNTEQYVAMRMEAIANDGGGPKPTEYDVNGTWDKNRYTDWQDVFLGGSAKMTDINASISGGSDETQFLFSGGYNSQGTVFPGDNRADRFSTLFSVAHTSPNKKFNARFSSTFSKSKNKMFASDITQWAFKLAPNAPALTDENGDLNWETTDSGSPTWDNPWATTVNRFLSSSHNLITNVELGYTIVKGLKIKTNIGLNDIRTEERKTDSSDGYSPAENYTPAMSSLWMSSNSVQSVIIEPQANWESRIGKGLLNALVGGTYQARTTELRDETYKGFPSNALITDPNSAASVEIGGYDYIEYRYAAMYGRINYNWDQKYIVNFTGRRDGSSRFGPGRKFANLGAVGLAWIFSNENFAKNYLPFLSFGKIRASYGTTGNDQIGDYRYLDVYGAGGGYQGSSSLVQFQLFNPDYGWELNKKLEGALEFGFLSDRLFLTVAYYRNRSSNQLIEYQLAATTGASSVLQNSPATVQNSGLEMELTTVNISKPALRWTTSLNFTFSRNKLISFPNLESSSYATTYIVGRSLNMQKVLHYLGVDPATGLYQFEDVNHDGELTLLDFNSAIELGPDYYGGLNSSLSFKGLQLDVLFQFVKRQGYILPSTGIPGGATNQLSNVLEGRWQKPGDHATKQIFSRSTKASEAHSNLLQSDALAGEIFYCRLKNISISYRLPDKLIRGIKSRIYLQGQNLLTFTNFSGLDPEASLMATLPPLTTIVVGLQLTL